MRTQMIRGSIGGMLAALVLLLAAAPAGAHAELESSDPQDGATLASAPAVITFVFGEQILSQGNAVTLTDVAADSRLEVGPVEVDGDTVSVSWPQLSPAGEFRAAYRVVSADGHPIDGTITFTVQEAFGGAEPAPVAASASPAATPAVTPSATASAVPASTDASTDAAPSDEDAGAGLLAWVLGIGVAILIGAVAGTWFMRRAQ